MAQYLEGSARILSTNHQRVVLTDAETTDNIAVGDLFRFQADEPGFYYVGAVVDEVTFDLTGNYVGTKAFDTDFDYLITRDFTPIHELAELAAGDVDIREVFTFDMRKLDTILGTGGGGGGTGEFESGTRMLFDQDTAPTGWLRDTAAALNDRVVRIASTGRAHGGTWTIGGISGAAHTHAFGSHTHELPFAVNTISPSYETDPPLGSLWLNKTLFGAGTTYDFPLYVVAPGIGVYTSQNPRVGAPLTDPALLTGPGVGTSGSAAPAMTSDGSWRPLHRSFILCSKQ